MSSLSVCVCVCVHVCVCMCVYMLCCVLVVQSGGEKTVGEFEWLKMKTGYVSLYTICSVVCPSLTSRSLCLYLSVCLSFSLSLSLSLCLSLCLSVCLSVYVGGCLDWCFGLFGSKENDRLDISLLGILVNMRLQEDGQERERDRQTAQTGGGSNDKPMAM